MAAADPDATAADAPPPDPWIRLASVLAVALALAVRWPGLDLPPITDEQPAFPVDATAWDVVFSTESANNPPLLPLLAHALAPRDPVSFGRALSLACSSLAVGVGVGLGWRLGGGLAAVLAGAWLALDPMAIEHATLHRAYAPFVLVALLRVLAVGRALERPHRDPAVIALSLLLPWIHYLGAAVLGVEAMALVASGRLAHRRAWTWYAPAALSVVALFASLPWSDDPWVSGPGGGLADVAKVIGFAYPFPEAFLAALPAEVVQALTADPAVTHTVTAAGVVGLALLGAWAARDRPQTLPLLSGLAGAAIAAALLQAVHVIRPPLSQAVLPFAAPLVAAAPGVVRWAAPRTLAAWALLAWGLGSVEHPRRVMEDRRLDRLARADAAEAAAALQAERGGVVTVWPSAQLLPLRMAVTGDRAPAGLPRGTDCPGDRCVLLREGDAALWATARDPGPVATGPFLGIGARVPDGCEVVDRHGDALLAWCTR